MRKHASIRIAFFATLLTVGGIGLAAAILLVVINRTSETALMVMGREAESIRSA